MPPPADKAETGLEPAAGLRVAQNNLVPRHLTRNEGGKHAYLQSGSRVRIRRSLDGLQRRSAPCRSVANQRGSDEIDGCRQIGSGPRGVLGTLASSRLAGSLLGMDPGTRRLRLRILQTLLPRISLAALALFVKPKFRKPGKRQSHSKTSRRLPDHCPRAMATSSLAKTLRWSTSLTSLLVSVADRATHGDLCDT